MKNKVILGFVSAGVLLSINNVYAKGFANIEFTGEDNVKIGDTISVKMNVTNISDTKDGIVSLDGNLMFDSNVLEYVSSNIVDSPYNIYINEDYNYRLAGLDFTLNNGIKNDTAIYEFTFKAKSAGKTSISLNNYKLTDTTSYVDTIVIDKEINIMDKKEDVKPAVKSKKVEKVEISKVENTEDIVETNEEVKETVVDKIINFISKCFLTIKSIFN